jgi:hypothetical protein
MIAQLSGANPAYRGSSESWTFSAPSRGAVKTSGGIQVRQLQATMMSASHADITLTTSESGRFFTNTGMAWARASPSTESLQIDS